LLQSVVSARLRQAAEPAGPVVRERFGISAVVVAGLPLKVVAVVVALGVRTGPVLPEPVAERERASTAPVVADLVLAGGPRDSRFPRLSVDRVETVTAVAELGPAGRKI
jgi:hypothetical protein